ncbi:hypothetical protein AB0903_33565 [Streptomyces sp. NPDC048389]|uniref:hypothetical protein n=1 Tax=Streptomyces sp. NPDC048389 TaxID=3154622 RepID=UPI003456A763
MPYPTARPPAPNGPGNCPRCLADVIWCTTAKNRVPQMINADRDAAGNTAVRVDHLGRYHSRQLTQERPTPEAGENLHKPHIATSPTCFTPRQPRPPAPRDRRVIRPTRWQR